MAELLPKDDSIMTKLWQNYETSIIEIGTIMRNTIHALNAIELWYNYDVITI